MLQHHVMAGRPEPTALEVRRHTATHLSLEARAQAQHRERESITLGGGLSLDPDDHLYRRLTDGARNGRRDLSPLQQDRMLEICWYLWEQNAFAKRLVTMMTDLILGEGITVEAQDERIQEQIDLTWNHRINQLRTGIRGLHNALSLNGELILPTEKNPISGRPTIGFIDPYQVKTVETVAGNVLVADTVVLKSASGTAGERLKVVRENPDTGLLEGEVFYFAINKLPNSVRGRSDLMPLADWLDLYDQYLFAEVERLHLLSSFVWDWQIDGADDKRIKEKLRNFPTPKPGTIFAHNEKEKLEARTPDLKAADRSEAGRMLRVHIAGCYGMPLSWLGEIDSNKATIEGQNDVLLKTPAARQKEFAGFIDQILRFTIEGATTANPALFRESQNAYMMRMPEIAAKDIARVGQVLGQVVTAMDTAMQNSTMDRKTAASVTLALLKHLGVDVALDDVLAAADLEKEERQAIQDEMQAAIAAARGGQPGDGDGGAADEDDAAA